MKSSMPASFAIAWRGQRIVAGDHHRAQAHLEPVHALLIPGFSTSSSTITPMISAPRRRPAASLLRGHRSDDAVEFLGDTRRLSWT